MSDAARRASALRSLGRASGLAGGVTALALWLMFLASPAGHVGMVAMAALSAACIVAAWAERPGTLLVAATLSLVPVGVYLLATPSVYSGIGLGNLLCVAGGGLMLAGRRGEASGRDS